MVRPPRLRYAWFRAQMTSYGVPESAVKKLWRLARKRGREAAVARSVGADGEHTPRGQSGGSPN